MALNPFVDVLLPISRLDKTTFEVLLWLFYALAVITTVARTIIRYRQHKCLSVDDYLLIFATLLITAASAWMQPLIDDAYTLNTILRAPSRARFPKNVDEQNRVVYRFVIGVQGFSCLQWTAIYAAKYAYLFFFRQLVDRVRPLKIYWWCVVVFTALCYPVAIAQQFMFCKYNDIRILTCMRQNWRLAMKVWIATYMLDIISDLAIVSIAICLIWKVKIRLGQKLGLALFLCLSLVLVVISITRITTIRMPSVWGELAYDNPWMWFLGCLQTCLAICLVSLTAFRSLLVNRARERQDRANRKPLISPMINLVKGQRSEDTDVMHELPQIPSGTLTGMRTYIWGPRSRMSYLSSTLVSSRRDSDEMPIYGYGHGYGHGHVRKSVDMSVVSDLTEESTYHSSGTTHHFPPYS